MFVSFVLVISLLIQNPADSRLEKVLEKHKNSIKMETLFNIKTLKMEGEVEFYLNENSFENQSPSISGTFKEIIQRPHQRYYESNFDNVDGTFRQAYNRNEKWTIDGGGLKIRKLNETAMLQVRLTFDITPNLVNLEEKGLTLEYLGKRKLEDQLYHCVKLSHEHRIHFYYLDLKTCLVSIIAFQNEGLDEADWTKRYFGDYKLVNNIMFPHLQYEKVKMNYDITTMLFKYATIQTNTAIDSDIFKTPENP